MRYKRFLVYSLSALILICTLGVIGILAFYSLPISPQSAYQACRQIMLNTEGYGVWELRSSRFLLVSASYTFSDGFNDATCSQLVLAHRGKLIEGYKLW